MSDGRPCHVFEGKDGWFYSIRKQHASGCPTIPNDIRTVGPFPGIIDAQLHLQDQEGLLGGYRVTHAADEMRIPDLQVLVAAAEAPAPLSKPYW